MSSLDTQKSKFQGVYLFVLYMLLIITKVMPALHWNSNSTEVYEKVHTVHKASSPLMPPDPSN